MVVAKIRQSIESTKDYFHHEQERPSFIICITLHYDCTVDLEQNHS